MSFIMFVLGIILFFISLKLFSKEMYLKTENRFLEKIKSLSNNKVLFFILGLIITSILQSSSLTICLLLIMIHNKKINKSNSIYFIMGSNIGTCVTAYLFSLPTELFIIISLIIILILLIKKYNLKIGLYILLIFISIYIMKVSSSFLNNNIFIDLLTKYHNNYYYILISTIITGIIQSSSIFISIIQSFIIHHLIPIKACFYMILGTNIGTSITALILGYNLDKEAKECSYINIIFNVLGSIFMIIIMYILPITKIIIGTSTNLSLVIANFNLLTNIINVVGVLILIKIKTSLACPTHKLN